MKQFGTSPLSTNPLFLSNFFMTPLFGQISKTRSPPPSNFRGEETMKSNKKYKPFLHCIWSFEGTSHNNLDAVTRSFISCCFILDFTSAYLVNPCLIKYCDVPNSVTKFYVQIADKKLMATVFPLMLHEANAWAVLPS